MARLLLRAEAVSSSFIEGLTLGPRRLLKAEINLNKADRNKDTTAAAIIGNIHAMQDAISLAKAESFITIETLQTMHKSLLSNTSLQTYGGVIRDRQNWIGGNCYSPIGAAYIPPPPELVYDLLEDLVIFCNRSDLSPVMQAAIAHTQFESIHPFVDGNGRCGRALIHLILLKRGLCTEFVPPISLILATHSQSYVECLSNYHSENLESVNFAINEWVEMFSNCCIAAVEQSAIHERLTLDLIENWKKLIGETKSNALIYKLLEYLPGMPIFTANQAAEVLNVSPSNIYTILERLENCGVLHQTTAGKRNRVFEANGAIDLYSIFERKLTSPSFDTCLETPARPVSSRTDVFSPNDGRNMADVIVIAERASKDQKASEK